jgi:anti-sigma B factor antagonist
MSSAVLHVTVESLDDARLVRARGEVDMSSVGALEAQLSADGPTTTLLDLSGISFMDSTGLHALLDATRAADEHGGRLFVVRPSPQVLRLFEVSGTLDMLRVVTSDWPAPRIQSR